MTTRRLTIVFIVAFLNLVGFGIVIPLIPYFAGTLGADAMLIGLLIASYPAAQLISAPLLGRLSDRLGRRPVLMLTMLGNALAFVAFGLSATLNALFISRILSGLMMGNSSVVQAYVSDLTEGEERTYCLGRIGAALGLGFVVGPAIGGLFSAVNFSLPAYIAAAFSLINTFVIYWGLPESLQLKRGRALRGAGMSLRQLMNAIRRPLMGSLLTGRFVFSLAFATFTTIFALFAREKLKINAAETGYLLAYAGLLIILVQGVLIERLVRRFNEGVLLFSGLAGLALSMLGWAYTVSVLQVVLVMVPLMVFSGIFQTVVTSAFTRVSRPREVGGILGLSLSIDSLTRVIAPGLGGYLMERFNAGMPALFGALLLALILPHAWQRYVRDKNPLLESRKNMV